MRQSTPYENRYCTGCQCTTRHEVKDSAYSCQRCGVVKYPNYNMKEALRLSTPHGIPAMPLVRVCCA